MHSHKQLLDTTLTLPLSAATWKGRTARQSYYEAQGKKSTRFTNRAHQPTCSPSARGTGATLRERWQAAAFTWQDTSLGCVWAKGFLRAVPPTRSLLLGCHSVQEIQI